MFKSLISLVLLIKIALSECLQGCRICSSNNQCLFCDFQLNYALIANNCKVYSLTNCTLIDPVGTCLSCSKNNYLDPITATCLPLSASNNLPNCQLYSSSTSCSQCLPGFYVNNGLCVAVSAPIVNCTVYNSSDPSKCLLCQNKFVLDQDQKNCLPIQNISDCSGYSVFKCNSCTAGYLLDMNMNLSSSQLSTTPSQRFYIEQQLIYDYNLVNDQGVYSTCNPISVKNCSVFINVNKCLVCQQGFYVDGNNQCQPFPQPIILNCNVYLNFVTCINCNNGYYLVSPTNCSIVPVITPQTCISYNTSASIPQCTQCISANFLNADGICQARSISQNILNCLVPQITKDLCSICGPGFLVTNDGLLCLPIVANCSVYAPSSQSTIQLVCNLCNSGYYLVNSLCQLIQISNCVSATNNNGNALCTQCINQYYINNNICVIQPQIPFCSTYSQSSYNTCSKCIQNYFLFTPTNICLQSIYIMKCLSYFSTVTCATCSDGYFVQNAVCVQITSPLYCLQITNSICTKCQPGYYLTTSNTCAFPDAFFSSFCAINNANGIINSASLTCIYCTPGAVLNNYNSSYVCMEQNNFPNNLLVTGCNRYSNETGSLLCTYCGLTQFLVDTLNTCVSSCSQAGSNYVLKVIEVVNSLAVPNDAQYSYITLKKQNTCVVGTNYPGCAVIFPDLFTQLITGGEATYICGICKSGFIPVIQPNSIIQFNTSIIFAASAISYQSVGPVQNYPGVQCILLANFLPSANSIVPATLQGCDMYYLMSNGFYSCYRCQFGFSGPIGIATSSNPAGGLLGGIVSCTTQILDCKPGVFWDIFIANKTEISAYSTNLGSLYSCHSCSLQNEIPYIAIDFSVAGSIPSLRTFGIPNTGTNKFTDVYSINALHTNCYLNTLSSFGYTSNFNYVQNCGLGVINVWSLQNSATSTSTNPVANQTGTFCYACTPGYRPVRVSLGNIVAPLMVVQCNLISNCQTSVSTWFNACTRCASGYVYQYIYNPQNVRFDTCVAYTDMNCMAANIDGAQPFCVICNIGFNKNFDGICESIQAPNCIDSQYIFGINFNVTFTYDQHSVGVYLLGGGAGCLTCATGYVGVKVLSNQYYCTQSSYLTNNQYLTIQTSIFNQRCLNYGLNSITNTPTCIVCINGYIQNLLGGCIPQLPNCLVATTEQACSQCQSNYILILGACQLQKIANCVVYSSNPTATAQTCQTCASGYYPIGSTCVVGSVSNCVSYQSQFVCQTCANSYYPVQISGGTTYCFPVPANQNCNIISSVFNVGTFTCSQCATNYAISTTQSLIPNSVCFPIIFIPNCLTYNLGSTITSSTYVCSNCTSGFFLLTASNNCTQRTNLFRQCAVYTITADTCSACMAGYFLTNGGTICTAYPTGILGCINYASAINCTQCDRGLFFNGTSCNLVPSNQTVVNCDFYKDAKTCIICSSGFALISGNCIASSALNCLTWSSVTSCGSCYNGYGIQTSNGLKNCVAISDSQCITYAPFFPFSCSLCKTGYFPLNGICTIVTSPIQNCIIYDTATTCVQCSPSTILNKVRNACLTSLSYLQNFDPNCNFMTILPLPACNKCNMNYLFVNGTCSLCSNATINVGCYYCNPLNQNQCMMCKSEFYQNLNGSCINNSFVAIVSTPNSTNLSNSTNQTSNSSNSTVNNTNFTTSKGLELLSSRYLFVLFGILILFKF